MKWFLIIFLSATLLACNKGDKQPLVVYTYPVTDVTLRQAFTGGYVVDAGGPGIIRRGIIWSTSTEADLSNYDGIKEEGEGGGEFISHISGLEPGNKYYARAFATNHTETGYGQAFAFTTGIGSLEIDMEIENISHFSVTAHCYLQPDAEVSIAERGFVWNIGTLAPQPTIKDHTGRFSKGAGNSSFSSDVEGFSSYRNYKIRAYAINSLDTFYSKTLFFRTLAVEDGTPGEVTDIDGNTYSTITLGGIEWMTENLRTKRFNDGTRIPNVADNHEWANISSPALSWYWNDEEAYAEAYGALYNRYAITTEKLCPKEWQVPSKDMIHENIRVYLSDFYNLAYSGSGPFLSMSGNHLKSCRQVESPLGGDCDTSQHPRWNRDFSRYGLDSFGFSGLPAGSRSSYSGSFQYLGNLALWWTSEGNSNGTSFSLSRHSGELHINSSQDNNLGLSVRCMRGVTAE